MHKHAAIYSRFQHFVIVVDLFVYVESVGVFLLFWKYCKINNLSRLLIICISQFKKKKNKLIINTIYVIFNHYQRSSNSYWKPECHLSPTVCRQTTTTASSSQLAQPAKTAAKSPFPTKLGVCHDLWLEHNTHKLYY